MAKMKEFEWKALLKLDQILIELMEIRDIAEGYRTKLSDNKVDEIIKKRQMFDELWKKGWF